VTPPRSKTIFVFAAGWLVLLAATYAFSWHILANRWRSGIDAWVKAQADAGWTITTGTVAVSGFPGAIRFALPEPSARNAAGDSWQGPPLTLRLAPWNPLRPAFEDPGTHRITLAGQPAIEVSAGQLSGTVRVDKGKPVALDLAAQSVAGLGLTAAGLTGEVSRPQGETDAPVPTLLAAVIGIDRLTLPEGLRQPLDRTIAGAHLALRLRGPWPRGPHAAALAAWRDGGGTIELDSFDIDWPPLAVAGQATVALDAALQPELAGTVTVRGAGAAIDQAAKVGMMDKGGARVAKLALKLASKPSDDGTEAAEFAVGVQNRVLSVGPVPLLQVPEVSW